MAGKPKTANRQWGYRLSFWKSRPLPAGKYGARLDVTHILFYTDSSKGYPAKIVMTEHHRVLEDSHKVAKRFRTGITNPIMQRGRLYFGDGYLVQNDSPLPPNFRFRVQQTYKANGQAVVGANEIIFTATTIILKTKHGNRWKIAAIASSRSR